MTELAGLPVWSWIAIAVLLVLGAIAARAALLLLRQVRSLTKSLEEAGRDLREALEVVSSEVRRAQEGLERIGGESPGGRRRRV